MLETLRESNDFLSMTDIDILRKIEHIRMNFGRFIDKKELIEKVKELIDESIHFSFKNERVKKYISVNAPSFIINADFKLIEEDFGRDLSNVSEHDQNNTVTFLSRLISTEVTSKASDIIIEKMKDSEEITKVLSSKEIDVEEDTMAIFESASFFIASIFGITCNLEQNTIVIEMII